MIDTHCHIDDPQYTEGLDAFLVEQRQDGVEAILVPGVDKTSVKDVLEVCNLYPDYLFPALGLHPENVKEDWREQLATIKAAVDERMSNSPKGVQYPIGSTPSAQSLFGNTLFTKIISYTCGACDARMSGAMVQVMSNSGSGNQGISCSIPVYLYAKENQCSEEQTLRALALSNLTVIYIKQSLGRLSALCGCVVAATGSAAGITYLMGGNYEEITYAIKNMIANISGMICDGAKPGCALKVTSGVATAIFSAYLAMQHSYADSTEGIVEDDIDRTIRNLTRIGHDGMKVTDDLILDIMTHKQ